VQLRARAVTLPAVVPELVEVTGAHTLADKLDRARSGGEIVALRIPAGPGQLTTKRAKFYRLGGADQCVEAMVTHGWNGFERPLPDLVIRVVRATNGCFVDVGANTGLYSLIAAGARRGAKVLAFEAYPPVVGLLRDNVALNPRRKHITIVPQAVADAPGELVLYVPPSIGVVETSSSLDPNFKDEISEEVKVPATTLDTYWLSHGRPEVSTLKVDVEGAEHRVLAGAEAMVQATRPIIFYEFLTRGPAQELTAFAARQDLVDVRLGPTEAVVGDEIRYHELAWNHAFFPRERAEMFLELLRDSGLVVTDLRP
jgi:FkbM family methyltransferase